MPLTRSNKRKAGTDLRNRALDLVFAQGYLEWYRLEPLQIVCKDWKTLVRETNHKDLPIWNDIIQYISRVNGANHCRWCGVSDCDDCSGPYTGSACLGGEDPRNNPCFKNVSKFKQARQLVVFHKTCILNLLSFYDHHNFACSEATVSKYEFSDYFYSLNSLALYCPEVYWLLIVVAELSIAKFDLGNFPYFFELAFCGIFAGPHSDEMMFRLLMASTVHDIIQSVPPSGPPDEPRGFVPNWGSYAYSQVMDGLEGTLRDIITKRDQEADALFGPDIADQMNVFYSVRVITLTNDHIEELLERSPDELLAADRHLLQNIQDDNSEKEMLSLPLQEKIHWIQKLETAIKDYNEYWEINLSQMRRTFEGWLRNAA